MLSFLLVAAAAALFFGIDAEKLKAILAAVKGKVTIRQAIAVTLVFAAVMLFLSPAAEQPTPEPDAGPLSLRGVFLGPTASDDAALVGALCLELADELEFDAGQAEPFFKTGIEVDEFRKIARVLRCRGMSIGDRQPTARDTIAKYLDEHVGTDGGPLSQEQRAAWISAFRDVGRAATDASK
jgi:hypothetical protein